LQLKKAKQGTFTVESEMSVGRLSYRYGRSLIAKFDQIFLEHGGQALELAIEIAEIIDWDDPQ